MGRHNHTDKSTIYRKTVTPRNSKVSPGEPFLFPICVGARNKDVEDMALAYLWAEKKFNIRALLLGDGLYRITLRICKGLDLVESEKIAIAEGKELVKNFLEKIGATEKIIIKTSDILQNADFDRCYRIIDELYGHDIEFKQAVDDNACLFVERQRDHRCLCVDQFEAVILSIFYLKQEIAVYLFLAEQGWPYEVYLGQEIPALVKIMTGKVPAAPQALKRRVNIGLQKKVRVRRQIMQGDPQASFKMAKTVGSLRAHLATSVITKPITTEPKGEWTVPPRRSPLGQRQN